MGSYSPFVRMSFTLSKSQLYIHIVEEKSYEHLKFSYGVEGKSTVRYDSIQYTCQ